MNGRNTAEQWSRLWRNAPSRLKELRFSVEKAEKSLVWASILDSLGGVSIDSLHAIEIGAGAGTISAVFARNGAQVTVLDYSQEALDVSAALFESFGLKHESLLSDALNLPASLLGRFDVAISLGLAEHFENEDRTRIVRAHFDLLRPGGLAILTVPNRFCLPYRMWKKRREVMGKWHFGMELPYSRGEISSICHALGVTDFHITGTSFLASLDFVFPFARWKRSIEKRILKDRRFDPHRIVQERTSILGAHFGYALVLIARKASS
jgi:2-polyprenyl-3-methyl-5-hydroxy-6-metoxy-1,4-benzoquinol methylase